MSIIMWRNLRNNVEEERSLKNAVWFQLFEVLSTKDKIYLDKSKFWFSPWYAWGVASFCMWCWFGSHQVSSLWSQLSWMRPGCMLHTQDVTAVWWWKKLPVLVVLWQTLYLWAFLRSSQNAHNKPVSLCIERDVNVFSWIFELTQQFSLQTRVSSEQEHFLIVPFGLLYSEVTASSLVRISFSSWVSCVSRS